MNSKALKLKCLKNSLWQRFRISNSPVDADRFKTSINRLRKLTRQLRKSFETQLVKSMKKN